MYGTFKTLPEDRLTYPDSASIPRLTQNGLLGILLDQQHYKAAKLARQPRHVEVAMRRSAQLVASAYEGISSGFQKRGPENAAVAQRRPQLIGSRIYFVCPNVQWRRPSPTCNGPAAMSNTEIVNLVVEALW